MSWSSSLQEPTMTISKSACGLLVSHGTWHAFPVKHVGGIICSSACWKFSKHIPFDYHLYHENALCFHLKVAAPQMKSA
eukprot:1159258-Pelagomonas_calceolata.AAC.8